MTEELKKEWNECVRFVRELHEQVNEKGEVFIELLHELSGAIELKMSQHKEKE